jgi:hypothetical protein
VKVVLRFRYSMLLQEAYSAVNIDSSADEKTYSMERSPSREARSGSATQEILRL